MPKCYCVLHGAVKANSIVTNSEKAFPRSMEISMMKKIFLLQLCETGEVKVFVLRDYADYFRQVAFFIFTSYAHC